MSNPRSQPNYLDYRDLIHKNAWRSHRFYPYVPVEEFFAEGCLLFCSSLTKWNPDKGTFSTFLTTCLRNGMVDYAKKWMRRIGEENDFMLLSIFPSTSPSPERETRFKEACTRLSEEARAIVSLSLYSPQEYFSSLPPLTPKQVRGALYRTLRKYGWSWPKIWRSFREIKDMLYEMEA